jgi:hypothetical protein
MERDVKHDIPMVWAKKDHGDDFLRVFQHMLKNVGSVAEDAGRVVVGAVVEPMPEHDAHMVRFLTQPQA